MTSHSTTATNQTAKTMPIIVLTAGHGGKDMGAVNANYQGKTRVKQADKIGIGKSDDDTLVLGENGFGGSPVASHLFDKLWYDKAKQALGQKHALQAIAKDMASDVRVAGFLAWVRQLQTSNKLQGKTYGVGVLSESSFSKLATEHGVDMQELSPVVGLKDSVVAGEKYDQHITSGDALDGAALEKIVRQFGIPDYELWDTKNKSVLLVYKTNEGRTVKLSVKLDKSETLVVSGFYVNEKDIQGGIARGFYQKIQ